MAVGGVRRARRAQGGIGGGQIKREIRPQAGPPVGDHHRRGRLAAHIAQRLDHLGFGVARRVGRPRLPLGKTGLKVAELVALAGSARQDHAAMVACRRVELHAIELQHFGHGDARAFELGIGLFVVQLRMQRPAMIGRDDPAQPVFARHLGIGGDRIAPVLPDQWRRRGCRIGGVGFVISAEPAVNVMIPGKPYATAGIIRHCGGLLRLDRAALPMRAIMGLGGGDRHRQAAQQQDAITKLHGHKLRAVRDRGIAEIQHSSDLCPASMTVIRIFLSYCRLRGVDNKHSPRSHCMC